MRKFTISDDSLWSTMDRTCSMIHRSSMEMRNVEVFRRTTFRPFDLLYRISRGKVESSLTSCRTVCAFFVFIFFCWKHLKNEECLFARTVGLCVNGFLFFRMAIFVIVWLPNVCACIVSFVCEWLLSYFMLSIFFFSINAWKIFYEILFVKVFKFFFILMNFLFLFQVIIILWKCY